MDRLYRDAERYLKDMSVEELKNFRRRIDNEISQRPESIKKKKRKILQREYDLYNTIIRRMGPKGRTLNLYGWSFETFVNYMAQRRPEGTISEIFEEEAASREQEWVNARKQNREPVYTSLIDA